MTPGLHMRLSMPWLALAVLAAPAANAAEPAHPALDRAWLRLGVFDARSDLDLRWDTSLDLPGSGTVVESRRDLGLQRKQRRPAFELGVLLADRHQLKVYGRSVESGGERFLQRDLSIDGQIYPTDALVDSRIELDQLGVAWTVFAWQSERSAFGVGVGALRYQLDLSLRADIETEVEGVPVQTQLRSGLAEQQWLPLLRAEFDRRLSEHWRLGSELAWVRKPSGRVRGNALEAAIELEYLPSPRWGVALRYELDRIDLDYRRSALAADLKLQNRGPQLLARWRF